MDVDHVEEEDWQECQDRVSESRKPFMEIQGLDNDRAEVLVRMQHLGGNTSYGATLTAEEAPSELAEPVARQWKHIQDCCGQAADKYGDRPWRKWRGNTAAGCKRRYTDSWIYENVELTLKSPNG